MDELLYRKDLAYTRALIESFFDKDHPTMSITSLVKKLKQTFNKIINFSPEALTQPVEYFGLWLEAVTGLVQDRIFSLEEGMATNDCMYLTLIVRTPQTKDDI